jgi:hypothetical protein
MHTSYLYRKRYLAHPISPTKIKPSSQGHCQRRITEIVGCGFYISYFRLQWVSPLVIFSKRNGKWRICVDYKELNKATQKDHFPLTFIDQVLDTLVGMLRTKYQYSIEKPQNKYSTP